MINCNSPYEQAIFAGNPAGALYLFAYGANRWYFRKTIYVYPILPAVKKTARRSRLMMSRRFVTVFMAIFMFANVALINAQTAYLTTSVEEIAASLPARPIAIGLDVDDTVLFSSPGFQYAFSNTDGPDGTNKYGNRPLSNDQFWSDLSCQFDKFSIPKESARKIIELHRDRGDKIYFITARPPVKGEILTSILHREFKLENQPKAIFSGRISKAEFIKKHGLAIYYGDSDSDISEAHDAGVRAIRFMRSPLSNNKGKYNPGKHGEIVLENSEN
ncbi:MAG: class B acid phosphatase [Candidatus Riflebacteria bacterium HGW-Riflebacteria-2]|jgi:acid phosphatase (class B)|nr:MAG: class B acid phosphatase [Candidatus Riflebacteria bacterium HGW-Riflebacteria-2]